MDVFYVLVNNSEQTLTLEKVTNELSVLPAFRSQDGAKSYLDQKIHETFHEQLRVIEFSIPLFDHAQSWAEKSGITLYIRLAN